MKQVIIISAVFLFLCFVISIPIMEERYHVKNDPHFLDMKYQLKNPVVETLPSSNGGRFAIE